ncbi:hypothetical protein NDU88_003664 [Pleurodeles waltl]|uniref:Uncharacterized protein n=1 Tax=Pleurodeles waltl TaxID=8319 RepID=A0AAV7PDT4_PLEWA|nr:hypothetical protein NDU88_003664 [Pleurodeles waltl]
MLACHGGRCRGGPAPWVTRPVVEAWLCPDRLLGAPGGWHWGPGTWKLAEVSQRCGGWWLGCLCCCAVLVWTCRQVGLACIKDWRSAERIGVGGARVAGWSLAAKITSGSGPPLVPGAVEPGSCSNLWCGAGVDPECSFRCGTVVPITVVP